MLLLSSCILFFDDQENFLVFKIGESDWELNLIFECNCILVAIDLSFGSKIVMFNFVETLIFQIDGVEAILVEWAFYLDKLSCLRE